MQQRDDICDDQIMMGSTAGHGIDCAAIILVFALTPLFKGKILLNRHVLNGGCAHQFLSIGIDR
ncbi:MAG TPA: hypothetical protein VFZ66_26905 [Herpetosiphonaceae bacterium]